MASVNSFGTTQRSWSHQIAWSPYDVNILANVHLAIISGDLGFITLDDNDSWVMVVLTCSLALLSRWASVLSYFAATLPGSPWAFDGNGKLVRAGVATIFSSVKKETKRNPIANLVFIYLFVANPFFMSLFIIIAVGSSDDAFTANAVRALGFGLAGANPAIRLSLLCDDMQTDPVFFQVVRVLADFRRFARKSTDLLRLWQGFVANFDGIMLSGPFSKLYEIFEQLGWSILAPPWFLDHDQCRWDLLSLSSGALHGLLCDAWYQRLARDLSHRQDYSGLNGLTWPPSTHEKRLSPVDLASINVIRDGTFYVGAAHGKFDLKKGSVHSVSRLTLLLIGVSLALL